MAVGIESVSHLKKKQSERINQTGIRSGNGLYTFTRNVPKQVDNLIDGGSIYWVFTIVMFALLLKVMRVTFSMAINGLMYNIKTYMQIVKKKLEN